MTTEELRILAVFRDADTQAGQGIPWWKFGDAIIWESGFIRDESVRKALSSLEQLGYVVEANAALILTDSGYARIQQGIIL